MAAHDRGGESQGLGCVRFGFGGSTYPPGATWPLLDPNHTLKCTELANLMARAMLMLGVPASRGTVYGSLDGSDISQMHDGTCNDPTSPYYLQPAWLMMYFEGEGEADGWNAYEGFCSTAGNFYALNPDLTEPTSLALYQALPFMQGWVVTPENSQPGNLVPWLPVAWSSALEKPWNHN